MQQEAEVRGGIVPEWTLGERLAKARHLAEMDQQQMADQLGVHRVTVARWEQSNNLAVRTILRWAEITGIAAWWLLGLSGPDNASYVYNAQQLELLTGVDAA